MKLNIIKGDIRIKSCIEYYYDYALKFYGSKYKKIIDNAINETYFYDMDKDEDLYDAIATCYEYYYEGGLTKFEQEDLEQVALDGRNCAGLQFRTYDNLANMILIRNNPVVDYETSIIHELYGHAISNNYNNYINEYMRNGFSYNSCDRSYLDLLNEGFTELFARKIFEMGGGTVQQDQIDSVYHYPVLFANILFEKYDKDKIIESYITGKPPIKKLFNMNKIKLAENFLIAESYGDIIIHEDKIGSWLKTTGKNKVYKKDRK